MGLKDQITEDMKLAMKAQDVFKRNVLRMVLSEIKYAQSAVDMRTELEESVVVKVVGQYKKKLEKSIADFPDGEQKDNLQNEIDFVASYLPKQLSAEDIEKFVVQVVGENSEEKNFGILIKKVMALCGEGADGKLISSSLKAKLG